MPFMSASAPPTPPIAPRHPRRIEQLGRVRVDDYAWMKDDNWQAVMRDPALLRADIRQHLEAENAYTGALLAPTKPLQEALFAEMRGRIKEDDASVPEPDGPFIMPPIPLSLASSEMSAMSGLPIDLA